MKLFPLFLSILLLTSNLYAKDTNKDNSQDQLKKTDQKLFEKEINDLRIKDSIRYEKFIKEYVPKFENFEKSNSNHLTAVNFVLGGIGILFSIIIVGFGIFTFAQYKKIEKDLGIERKELSKKIRIYNIEYHKKVNEIDTIISDKLAVIGKSINDYSEQIKNLEEIQKEVFNSNIHIQNGLNLVFEISLALAEKENDKKLLNNIYEYQYIAELYSNNKDRKFSSLSYLQHLGTSNSLKHLKYIAKNDTDLYYRDWANQIIGKITQKNKN